MPDEFVRYGESFERLHPGWEIRLWTEENIPLLRNQAAYDSARSYAQKADILRYELLFTHGGVYIDTDFECRKPLDELIASVSAFAATEDTQWISIGILGSVPGYPLFEAVIESLPRSIATQPEAPANVQTGPLFFTRIVAARRLKQLDDDFVVFSPKLFYPYGCGERHRRDEAFPEAYAVHHWAGSWCDPDAPAPDSKGNVPLDPSAIDSEEPDEPLRLLVGFDPQAPRTALALLVAYSELFGPKDRVELGIYAYAEPSLPLLDCVRQLLRLLVRDPDQMAPLSLYSRAELTTTPYAAAFFPSGDDKEDAAQMARAFAALHAFRAMLTLRQGRSTPPSLPEALPRERLLESAAVRPTHERQGADAAQAAPEPSSALCGTALGNGRVLVRTKAGFPLLCSAEDLSLTPDLVLHGEYDPPFMRFLQMRLAPGHVAFDVGANIGLFSVLMARLVADHGHVVAYEALPSNFALLRDNVSLNYLATRCTLLQRAAWSSDTELTFHASSRFLGNGSVSAKSQEYALTYPGDAISVIKVKATPLSRELDRFERVELVKIDVEGGEYQVLRGMREAVEAGKVRIIVFECLRSLLGDDFSPLIDLLADWEQKYGLRCHRLDPTGRTVAVPLARVAEHGRFTQLVVERR